MATNENVEQRRLGYRTPRSILLPPYLELNAYYGEYTDAVDAVFGPLVDDKISVIQNMRNMWVGNPAMEQKVLDHEMLNFADWSQPERDILVKQANLLGMKFQNAGVLSNDSYQMVTRYVGLYWFEKGTEAFIEFINYCLDSALTVQNLWTPDYINFLPEGNAGIGTPIWEGGEWYPTTHVQITAKGGLGDLDLKTLISFFYEIANYNLVLQSVDASYDMYVVDRLEDGHVTADIVAVGIFADNAIVIANTFRYGADAPPVQELANGANLPTKYYRFGADVDFSTAFLLVNPSAWILDPEGNKVPVYAEDDREVTDDTTIPTQLMGGGPDIFSNYTVLYGPVEWIKVPGSSRSKARIPVFSSQPTQASASSISTRMVGRGRTNILVNPKGFTELVPGSGKYTPYW